MPKRRSTDPDISSEYDFSSAPRGKFHARYRGVRFKGAVVLDPDVRRAFPDSVAVNEALRTLLRARLGPARAARPTPAARARPRKAG